MPTNESAIYTSGETPHLSLLENVTTSSAIMSSNASSDVTNVVHSNIIPSKDDNWNGATQILPAASFHVDYSNLDGSTVSVIHSDLPLETAAQVATEQNTVYLPESTLRGSAVVINPSKCLLCYKEFAVKSSLKKHLRTAHSSLHFCMVCFQAFTSKENLSSHKSLCKSTFSCPECAVRFSSKIQLNLHREKVHNVTGLSTSSKKTTRNFHCTHCDASFFQMSDLSRHILGHTGEKPFKCKMCMTAFTRKSSLTKHYRIHTGEKPYSCPHCSVCFAYRYQYNRHVATHKTPS